MKTKITLIIVLSAVLAAALVFGIWYNNKTKETVSPRKGVDVIYEIPDGLDDRISQEILKHNEKSFVGHETGISVEAHELLGAEKTENGLTVYVMAMYRNYSAPDCSTGGGLCCAAISFEENESGYSLAEYWEPLDGGSYKKSITEKFPRQLVDKAVDTQLFADELDKECAEKAKTAWAEKYKTSAAGE
ncbi:MAG: hypothetical protein ACI4JA_02270 [Oscillospiraceae bacterium]